MHSRTLVTSLGVTLGASKHHARTLVYIVSVVFTTCADMCNNTTPQHKHHTMSIKGTPLDPNFGYHGADDYMKMLGEGQAANAYVSTAQRSEPEQEAGATDALDHTPPPRLPTDIFADLGRDYPDAQRLLDDNATYDRTHGILPEDSHPYGTQSWRDTAETHRALGTLAYPDARPATH